MIYHTSFSVQYIYYISIVYYMPRRYFSKKENVWKIHTTVSLREDVFARLESYARTYFNGNISSALEFIVDTFFKVINIATPPTKIIVEMSTGANGREHVKEDRKKVDKGEVDLIDEELNYIEVETALQHYISILEGYRSRLGEYLRLAKKGLRISPPNFIELKKQIDKISRDLVKFAKNRRIPVSLVDLYDKCQSLLKEVKMMLIEAERL